MDFIYTVIFVDKYDVITYHQLTNNSLKALKRLQSKTRLGKYVSVVVHTINPNT